MAGPQRHQHHHEHLRPPGHHLQGHLRRRHEPGPEPAGVQGDIWMAEGAGGVEIIAKNIILEDYLYNHVTTNRFLASLISGYCLHIDSANAQSSIDEKIHLLLL